jgi:phthiocerol/phenolphthiocerol synthesis type-I polyketide synthase E
VPSTPLKLAFLFADLRSARMAWDRHFYEAEPRLRDAMKDCDGEVEKIAGAPLLKLLDRTNMEHIALADFCFQYAQARLLMSLGIFPAVLAGSGAGAWVAATLAGSLSLRAGLRGAAGLPINDQSVAEHPRAPAVALVCGSPKRINKPGHGIEPGSIEACAQETAFEPNLALLRGHGLREFLWFAGAPMLGDHLPNGDHTPPRLQLANTVAELYVRGLSIDWKVWHRPHNARKVSLPTYPFQRRRCWLEADEIRPPIGVPKA